jgi:hypothetical protein
MLRTGRPPARWPREETEHLETQGSKAFRPNVGRYELLDRSDRLVNQTNTANARRPELVYHSQRLTPASTIALKDDPDPGR